MELSLTEYLAGQPLMQVLLSLAASPKPRHLRDLAAGCALSLGGVSDILRRLTALGVLEVSRRGNRKCFSLKLGSEEQNLLEQMAELSRRTRMLKRAERFGRNAGAKLKWMDQSYLFFRQVKAGRK